MKILICTINSKYIHSSFAAWCLAGGIKHYANGTEFEIIEGTINEKIEDLVEKILKVEFDIIGFSAYIWNINYVLTIAKLVKEKTNKKVVIGGPEVSYNAEEILQKYQFIDYVISGEGEKPLALLTQGVENFEGICHREGNKIIIKEPYISNEKRSFLDIHGYVESLNGRIAYIETSRGCPFQCAFCLSGRCGGVTFFDLDEAKRNIILLAQSGTQTVKFIDRTFNANKKRAIEIFEFIIENYSKNIPESVCFHFEIEGELIDDEMINVLSKAPKGLFQFEIGVQSFNETTLEYINRKTNLEKLVMRINDIIRLGNIHVHIDLIAGLPYEDFASFENSFNKALNLKPHKLQLGFLKSLHGSKMREDKKKYYFEYSQEAPYEVESTNWLSKNELRKLHLVEDVFEKLYNSGRFVKTCEYIFNAFKSTFQALIGFAECIEKQFLKNTLDNFTIILFNYFSSIEGINSIKLRDALAIDRLTTNRMGVLPEFLKVHSPKIKQILNELEKNPKTKREKGVKRSATILLTENKFVYIDYKNPDKITNSYSYQEILL